MKVLACGSRDWTDRTTIETLLGMIAQEHPGEAMTLIHGAGRGADRIAASVAKALGWTVVPYPWDNRYGLGGGKVRNTRMVKEGQPDLVVAFFLDWHNSPGTHDTVRKAVRAGIDVQIVNLTHQDRNKEEEGIES